jgi:hypothetical protein
MSFVECTLVVQGHKADNDMLLIINELINSVISSHHPRVQGHKAVDDKSLINNKLINDVIGKNGPQKSQRSVPD